MPGSFALRRPRRPPLRRANLRVRPDRTPHFTVEPPPCCPFLPRSRTRTRTSAFARSKRKPRPTKCPRCYNGTRAPARASSLQMARAIRHGAATQPHLSDSANAEVSMKHRSPGVRIGLAVLLADPSAAMQPRHGHDAPSRYAADRQSQRRPPPHQPRTSPQQRRRRRMRPPRPRLQTLPFHR